MDTYLLYGLIIFGLLIGLSIIINLLYKKINEDQELLLLKDLPYEDQNLFLQRKQVKKLSSINIKLSFLVVLISIPYFILIIKFSTIITIIAGILEQQ